MKKFNTLLVLSIFLGCALFGCRKKLEISDQLADLPDEPPYKNERTERIGIYVDVTPSMEGFLGAQKESFKSLVPETRYLKCLDEINKIVAIKFDEENIAQYRVDTPLWKVDESENVLDKAREKAYYQNSAYFDENYSQIILFENDSGNYDSPCLATALLNCINEDFSIVVTDFYENEANVNFVINALKKNIRLNSEFEKTVGIIGIKSEFAGKIYDISKDEKAMEYGIREEYLAESDISYRQFFIIVIGGPEMVKEFCKNVQKSMELDNDVLNYIIFYQDEIFGIDYNNFEFCESRDEKVLWENGIVVINEKKKLCIFDYRNTEGRDKDVVVRYAVTGEKLKKELGNGISKSLELPDVAEKKFIEIPCTVTDAETSVWKSDTDKFEIDMNGSDFFSIKNLYFCPENEQVYVHFVIDENCRETHAGEHIKFHSKIILDDIERTGNDWIEEWDFKNKDRDYKKTKDLKKYVNALESNMPERERLLLDFSFYITVI